MEKERTSNPTPEWQERYLKLAARLRDEIPEQINARNTEIERDFQVKRNANRQSLSTFREFRRLPRSLTAP